ncbi:GNAT family N-acetyltransferase [Celeribacter litoreus]|uniref:GNAT family N-acetyltransferase n=1 Tax=Celeribacter litoreus TaxID=2876714 RepID=UPI001CCB1A17|nr:N-acetyltransferase [Celeribacter litoreus]MCA0044082.1 N-acetyltransferase [Celeribacter litoreus]
MYRIEVEKEEDWWEVEALYDTCFAPGRELLSSYRLREGVAKVADLSLIARDENGVLAAAIRFWPVRVGEGEHRVLLLGPIAVHPTRQGEGLGALLMIESLTEAVRLGWDRVMLVGDAPYYERFGFEKLEHVEMPPPTNPERVLGLSLQPDAWVGVEGLVHRDA